MHALRVRLIELNNLHNIVHRTPQSKILATPLVFSRNLVEYQPKNLISRRTVAKINSAEWSNMRIN